MIFARRVGPLVGDPVYLLPGHDVHVPHVPAQVVHGGVRLLADGTRRLPQVLLHVFGKVPLLAVGDAADGAGVGTAG